MSFNVNRFLTLAQQAQLRQDDKITVEGSSGRYFVISMDAANNMIYVYDPDGDYICKWCVNLLDSVDYNRWREEESQQQELIGLKMLLEANDGEVFAACNVYDEDEDEDSLDLGNLPI